MKSALTKATKRALDAQARQDSGVQRIITQDYLQINWETIWLRATTI